LLRRCIGGVVSQDPMPDELLVVGRPEDSEARAVVDDVEGGATPVRWIEVTTPGHVPPVRRGLESADGDLIAFLDDDAVPDPGWLAALLEVMGDRRVACVGGRVDTPGAKPAVIHRDAGTVRWYGQHVGNIGSVDAPVPFDVDAVLEGNWMWRTEVLRGLTFLPMLSADDASMYGLDLCLQAKERGLRVVYQSAAVVLHTPGPRPEGSTARDDLRRTYRSYSRNMTLISLRHLHGVRRAAFVSWWWLVGERGSYGLATGFIDGIRRRLPGPGVLRACFVGKAEGVRAWRAD
jgi:GT2 family glycosyltransferase